MSEHDYCTTTNRNGRTKRRYRSPAAARKAIRTIRGGDRNDVAKRKLEPYKCRWCSGWHVAKQRETT